MALLRLQPAAGSFCVWGQVSELTQRMPNDLCTRRRGALGNGIDPSSQTTIYVGTEAHLAATFNAVCVAVHDSVRNRFEPFVSDPETHCNHLCLRFRPNLEGSMCVLDTLRLLREPNAHTLPKVVTARDLVA